MRALASAAFLALALAVPPAGAGPIPDDVGSRVAEGFAMPRTAAFADAAAGMRGGIDALCARPDAPALEDARRRLVRLVAAWGEVSVLRFGPLQVENRFERVFFWPDPRGVIVRQVQALLAAGDEAALASGALAGKSVAVQGLPALEFVLHGAGAEELETARGLHRCRYGAAVAGNLETIAQAFAAQWRPGAPFHDAFAAPGPDGDLYRSPKEVAAETVKAMATTLQFVRSAELLPALGESGQAARGRRAPLWRSDLTFALVAAQIDGVVGLLDAAGFAGDEAARPAVEALRFDLTHAREAVGRIEAPAEHAFAEEAERDRIRYVAVALDSAGKTLGGALSAALDLTMGFNALDGD